MKEPHGPDTLEAADAEQKVSQDLGTPGGVLDFGVELHPVEPPLGVTNSPGGAGVAAADDLEPRGGPLHHVAVAHPHGLGVAQAVEQVVAVADAEALRPYSLDWAGTTRPPSRWLKSWMP